MYTLLFQIHISSVYRLLSYFTRVVKGCPEDINAWYIHHVSVIILIAYRIPYLTLIERNEPNY